MKKILFLFVLLLITGCSATYNLEIDNEYIKEKVVLTFPNDIDKNLLDNQTSSSVNVHFDSDEKYNMSKSNDGNYYYVKYDYKHKVEEFNGSNFITKCFSDSAVESSASKIVIGTSSRFNCLEMEDDAYLDDVTVNIKTNLKVLKHNADEVNGKTYTWIFDASNYTDKSIMMEIKKSNNIIKSVGKDNILMIVIGLAVIGGIGLFIFLGLGFVMKKNKENNEF